MMNSALLQFALVLLSAFTVVSATRTTNTAAVRFPGVLAWAEHFYDGKKQNNANAHDMEWREPKHLGTVEKRTAMRGRNRITRYFNRADIDPLLEEFDTRLGVSPSVAILINNQSTLNFTEPRQEFTHRCEYDLLPPQSLDSKKLAAFALRKGRDDLRDWTARTMNGWGFREVRGCHALVSYKADDDPSPQYLNIFVDFRYKSAFRHAVHMSRERWTLDMVLNGENMGAVSMRDGTAHNNKFDEHSGESGTGVSWESVMSMNEMYPYYRLGVRIDGAYELQDEIRATEEIIDQTQKEFKEINNRVREQQQQSRNAEVELQRLSLNLMEAADNGTGEVPRITSVEASGPAASTSAARASISTLTLIRGLQRTGISTHPSSRTLDTLKAVERVLRAYKFATSTDQPPFTVHDVHEIFGRPDEERRTRLDQLIEMNDAADDDDVARTMGALPIVVWTFEATDGSRTLLRFEMNASTGNVLGCDLVFNW